MRESDKTSRKYISEMKKLSMSEKTRSDNPSSHSNKDHREDATPLFTSRGMKSLGRKYVQDNCFKMKEKEHHEIVISDQVVRNSKLYRMLKEKTQIMDAIFIKQSHQLKQAKAKLAQETNDIRGNTHRGKLALWELKNQILQLKGILNDEEEQTKRLETQLKNSEQYEQPEEQAQNEMAQMSQKQESNEQAQLLRGKEENEQFELQNEEMRQEERDIKMMMMQLHKKMKINPENEKSEEKPRKEKEEEGHSSQEF